MSYYSRRKLEALGEPLGEDATRVKPGGHGRIYGMGGGGGGGTTTSTGTTYNTNIPEYAEPYVNTMLSATQKQLFDMSGNEITGFKPYNPYSKNASDYVAPFSPMQQQAMRTAASPEAFGREVSGYMSPYMQNVVDIQKREAMRGAGIMGAQQQAQATGAGAFGGYREGIQRAENMRNLGTQMNDIQLKGQQMAFDDATKQARASQQLQMQYGQMQQSQEQQKINQAIQDYANAQQYPLMQLGVMSNMLRGLPMQAATTNQYVAAPNPITQGIGLAGAGASIYNATKGASGGLPREFKYAEGGITSIDDTTRDPNDRPGIREYMEAQNAQNATRFDVGGEVESQLESMDIQDLMKQAQESSSPTVRRMAQRILRERQMERGAGQGAAPTGPMGVDYQAPQLAGGGIIAFQSGEEVKDPYPSYIREGEGEELGSSTFFIGKNADNTDYYTANGRTMPKEYFDKFRALELNSGAKSKPYVYETPAPVGKSETAAVPMPEMVESRPMESAPPADKSIVSVPVAVPATDRSRGIVVAEPAGPAKAARDTSTVGTGIKDPTLNPPAVVGRVPESDRARGIVTKEPPGPVKAARDTSTPGIVTAPPAVSDVYPDESIRGRAAGIKAAPPVAAAPAPAAEEKMPEFTGPLADIRKAVWKAEQEAKLSEEDYLKRVKAGQPENTAAAEYRKQIMAERANAKDEAERQRWMRAAQFFAKWGSTPGPTLAAGLSALEKSMPDIISDEQGYKKAKRELDKIVYDVDQSIRQEELGNKKEARALKEKAADRALQLNHFLAQAQSAENVANIHKAASEFTAKAHVRAQEIAAHTAHLDRVARRQTDDDNKKYGQWQAATTQEGRVLERIAFEENGDQHKADVKLISDAKLMKPEDMPEGYADKIAAAEKRVKERKADWTARKETAQKNTDLAYSRVKVAEPAAAPAGGAELPEGIPKGSKAIGKDKASGKTVYQTPDGKKLIQD